MDDKTRKIIRHILTGTTDREGDVTGPRKIIVLVPPNILPQEITLLQEGKTVTIKGVTIRKDSPHFQGDVVHAHSSLPGGYEVSWGQDMRRRHPSKFPSNVPNATRNTIAAVLNVSPDLLEASIAVDKGEHVILIETNG